MPSKNHLNAVALLKADHREVEELFTEFEGAAGATKKQALVEKICTELSAHTVIEEEIFYPACRARSKKTCSMKDMSSTMAARCL
jgi:hemerythrin superfamily protein